MNFRTFLLRENHDFLGTKIGDVLTSIHELEEDMKGMGIRHLAQSSEEIVQQIRRVLHSRWDKTEAKFLFPLQKAAVAIMKAIEEKDDLKAVISSVKAEIEQLSVKLGVPQNSLATQDVQPTEPAEEKPKNPSEDNPQNTQPDDRSIPNNE